MWFYYSCGRNHVTINPRWWQFVLVIWICGIWYRYRYRSGIWMYFQGCSEGSHLPNNLTVCVWIMFILSAGLLLVTCRDYLPSWWTLWFQLIWHGKQDMCQRLKMYDGISDSHIPSCSGCRIRRELSLIRWSGIGFCLLCLLFTAIWDIIQLLEIPCWM